MDNKTLRSTILLTGHGLIFSTLFSQVFQLELLDSTREADVMEARRVFVVAIIGTLSAFGMFAAYRSIEKADSEHAHKFWLRRSLRMMFGLLISLLALHWTYGWHYVASMGLFRALLP